MYPKYLDNNSRLHWASEDVFSDNNIDWIHAFKMADYNIGMHTQGFFEINIVIKGKGCHYIEKQKLRVDKGDTFIIPPNVRHGYVGEEGFDVYHILIHKTFLQKYIVDLQALPFFYTLFDIEPLMRMSGSSPLYLKIRENQFNQINHLIDMLEEWSFPKDTFSSIMCNNSAQMLIAQLCMVYSENYSADSLKEKKYDAAFMESVSLIYEKYCEKITIERLSKTARLSRTAYITMFKRIMGITPMKFVLTHRLKVAKNFLSNTNLSIKDIADNTGFYDVAHFIHCFIREEGCSPLMFRRNSRISAL